MVLPDLARTEVSGLRCGRGDRFYVETLAGGGEMNGDVTLVACSRCGSSLQSDLATCCTRCGKVLCGICCMLFNKRCVDCRSLMYEAETRIACANCKEDVTQLSSMRCHKCSVQVCPKCWDYETYKCRSCRIAEEQLENQKGADG